MFKPYKTVIQCTVILMHNVEGDMVNEYIRGVCWHVTSISEVRIDLHSRHGDDIDCTCLRDQISTRCQTNTAIPKR